MKSQSRILSLLHFLSIIFFLDSSSIVHSDLALDRTALLALRATAGGPFLLRWNISDETPCNWTGVTCQSNRVVELRLPGMSFSGKLPIALGNITELRTLSLRFNAFSGPIPAEIGNLASLRNLYLQGNLFSGGIPEFLFNLQNLVRLNLGNNNFIGVISPNFNKLKRLATLCLDRNQLNGSIPDLNLGFLHQFNVSFNKLTGSIPKTLSSNPVNSFEGNSLCGKPLLLCNSSSIGDNHKLSSGAIIGIMISCFIGCLCQKKRIKQGGVKVKDASEISMADVDSAAATAGSFRGTGRNRLRMARNSVLDLNLEDLLSASAELISKGGFGTTYKAFLEEGMTIVVKRMRDFDLSEKEFEEMVEGIEKINHENLLPLRASFYSKDEKLLVHDYMPMGSLSALLHGNRGPNRTPLNWDTRISIALGAARAIAHLHSQSPSTSHGSIKSSNVLLTSTFEARVSDYGLAQFARPNPTFNRVVDGYLAPEVTCTPEVSQKADVYSYGVLFLELLTEKDPDETYLKDEGLDLPRWMLSAVNDEWTSEVFDVENLRYGNVEEVMLQLLELTFTWADKNPDNRPSMAEVITQIEMLCCSDGSRIH
ncbi:probable inactive receptor kinase At1g48480 [Euphorbia lathyris]|uniref:probable inactive receptor kinase At1g48480 n=1 Tax=Euphorbia lathyris TaxID=212925 RepID=UPI0033131431